ncbi:MAG: fluoride efflux transporter CrcB [Phototrophicaceae bacterium]|jgi:CrcB protein
MFSWNQYIRAVLWVGLGAFVGANVRYAITLWAPSMGLRTEWATLFINVSGSLLLGVFLGWGSQQVNAPPELRLLLATGFFGAYTTFSTFANETVSLINQHGFWVAILYILGTNGLCILGAGFGWFLGTR